MRILDRADIALFFYAGHGLQVAGQNYLIPVDARLQVEGDLDFEAIGVDFVLKQMELDRDGKTNVVFLDACRDNPLARNLARSMGTRSARYRAADCRVQAGVGTLSPTPRSRATSRSTARAAIARSPPPCSSM